MTSILVIDDEKQIQTLVKKCLERYNYKVLLANNGIEGLEIYKKYKTDIILLDLIMPGMDGVEFLKKILKFDPNVKIIVSSGYSVNGRLKDAFENGAKSFIGKPYSLENLLSTLNKTLNNKD